jgi:hypothetical protein
MFNRDRDRHEGPACVTIALEDGQELKGKVVIPPGRTLTELLNGGSAFIEFEPIGGARTFIAKSALTSVTPIEIPAAPDLWAGPTEGSNFDPFAVLGVKPNASREEAREAYLRLAKTYHPDRYAATELPQEVRNYLAVMTRRVNAAYQALGFAQKQQAAKEPPVFTKAAHG